jgi:hypothetical protein
MSVHECNAIRTKRVSPSEHPQLPTTNNDAPSQSTRRMNMTVITQGNDFAPVL